MTSQSPAELPDLPIVTVSMLDESSWEVSVDTGDTSPIEALGMLVLGVVKQVAYCLDCEDDFEGDG